MSTIVSRTLTATQLQNQKMELAIENKLSSLTTAIRNESTAREGGDFSLEQDIKAEVENRTAADSAITKNLDDEISARIAANNQIATLITAEANTRATNDSALDTKIGNESTERINGDKSLQDNLDDEISARTNADTEISNSLNTEIKNRKDADSTLQNNINAESTARTNADNQLAALISSLQNDVADDSAIENINKEIADLKSADTTLQNNIDTEISNRTAANTALNTTITNLESSLTKKINDVQSNLNTEIANRKAGDTGVNDDVLAQILALQNKIDNEIAARQNDIDTLKNDLEAEIARLRDELAESALSQSQSSGFAQNGTLTYNGNKQTVSIVNYDERYHVLGGTTQATTAGNYTATISPAEGFTWYDGSSAAKNVSWSIGAKLLSKPTAAATSFSYDGNNKTITINGYDSNTMTESGTVTASAVGSYSVSYSLKNTTNYHWADNSTTKVTINWSIGTASISKPTATNTSLTYNGNSQTLNVANFNADYMSQTGTITSTNAGSYTAVFKLKSGYKWSDNSTSDVSISWSIAVLKLSKPTATTTSYTYNGSTKTLSVSNYNSTYMNRTGNYSAQNAGDYSVTYTLKNTSNTCWSDNSTAAVVINWSIVDTAVGIAKPTATNTSFTYNTADQTLEVSGYNEDAMEQTGTITAKDAGSYSVVYKLKSGYKWADNSTSDVTINWSIAALKLPKASAKAYSSDNTRTGDYSFEYTSAGKRMLTYNYNEDYMTVSGTRASLVGNYEVVFSLKDKNNTCWEDGTVADIVIPWEITKGTITIPTFYNCDSSFTYDGTEKEVIVRIYSISLVTSVTEYAHLDGGSGSVSSRYCYTATEAGTYTIEFALKYPEQTQWPDGSISNKTLTWQINPAEIAAPVADSYEVEYLNRYYDKGYDYNYWTDFYVTGYDSETMEKSGSWSVGMWDGVVKENTAYITAKDNYIFPGGVKKLTYKWMIVPRKLDKPYIAKSANGKQYLFYQYFEGVTEDGDAYEGFYDENYCSQVEGQEVTTYYANNEYAGKPLKPVMKGAFYGLQNHKIITTQGANWTQTHTPGKFQYVITPTNLATWRDDDTRDTYTLEWYINPHRVNIPTLSASNFSYDGETKTVTINNFDPAYMESSGTLSASTVGEYTVTITTKTAKRTIEDAGSGEYTLCAWWTPWFSDYYGDDYAPRTITLKWSISSTDKVAKPSLADLQQEHLLYIKDTTQGPTINDYISTAMSQTGTTSAAEPGNYKITYKLKSGFTWVDGTRNNVVINWSIDKYEYDPQQLNRYNVVYNGKVQAWSNPHWGLSTIDISGTTRATNVGEYTVTAAINDKAHYQWSTDPDEDKVYTWAIVKRPIPLPATGNGTELVYTGEDISVITNTSAECPNYGVYTSSGEYQTTSVSAEWADYVNITGVSTASEPGTYTVTLSLKDKDNTQWANVQNTDDIVINWKITK